MNSKSGARRVVALGLLGAMLAVTLPVQAQHHGGGGGGGGFGGGHSMGGGGGHSMGGGGHSMGGGGHFTGGGRAISGAVRSGGGSFAGHFAGGGRAVGYGGRAFAGQRFSGAPYSPVHGGFAAGAERRGVGVVGRSGGGSAYWGRGGTYSSGAYWGGGYWRGGYWPRCYYGPGISWFLPVLPFGFSTFWWGGFPYYYWNNVYYTWNPGYNGYVVTDPPPVADGSGSAYPGDANGDYSGDYSDSDEAPPPQADGVAPGPDVYAYPRNGQSDSQAQTDRYQCHSWAVTTTGFDPTRPSQQASGSLSAYRRALIACLDARGYSAR
ncbi:MAG: hypothetical protein JSR67_00355 [Proteobacteria bacterium]|nr:hypothetical protein [Pseudomonadota bacterium]